MKVKKLIHDALFDESISIPNKLHIALYRIECLDKIKERLADFGTVDPEDMYVAGNIPNQDFAVFEEIRTREEPDGKKICFAPLLDPTCISRPLLYLPKI